MTEQEAEALMNHPSPFDWVQALPAPELAAHLSRVWGKPLSYGLKHTGLIQSPFSQSLERWELVFEGVIAPEVTLYYKVDFCSLSRCEEGGRRTGCLQCEYGQGGIGPRLSVAETEKELAQFADQWLALFRRNCWICGCLVQASTHEKAEWIQGLSREEVEAWNLKM